MRPPSLPELRKPGSAKPALREKTPRAVWAQRGLRL